MRTGIGEWWTAYSDFTNCFTHLTICHLEPQRMKSKESHSQAGSARVKWEEASFEVATFLRLVKKDQIVSGKLGHEEWGLRS